MINFNNLEIVRARMHKVHSKFSINRDTAEVEYLEDALLLMKTLRRLLETDYCNLLELKVNRSNCR